MARACSFDRRDRHDRHRRPARRRLHRRRCPTGSRTICRQVRDLVHAADPEVAETIKRTGQPYFVLDGNICALLAAKDHVNVFLYDGAIVPDPEGIITGGHDNKTARTVAIREGETINAPRADARCSGRSSPTTGPVAGESSSRAERLRGLRPA